MIHGDDVVLGVLPLFHVYGLNAVLGGVLRHRAKLLLVEQWDPFGVLDLIEDEAVSVLPIAPPVFAHWRGVEDLADRLGPVRLVLSGSAPLAPEVIEEFTAITAIPVHQGYGLTEASPVVTSTLCSETAAERFGRRGPARHRAAPRRRDRHPGHRRGPRRDPGQGRQPVQRLLAGRLRRPGRPRAGGRPVTWASSTRRATSSSSTGSRSSSSSAASTSTRPRSRTCCARCRASATPRSSGWRTTRPARPSSRTSCPSSGAAGLADAVRAHAAGRLARFKQPTRIEVVAELPLTGTGKVQKGRLRGMERRRSLGLLE